MSLIKKETTNIWNLKVGNSNNNNNNNNNLYFLSVYIRSFIGYYHVNSMRKKANPLPWLGVHISGGLPVLIQWKGFNNNILYICNKRIN